MTKLSVNIKTNLKIEINGNNHIIPLMNTYSDVPEGEPLIYLDDYGRTQIALNQGNFKSKYDISIGQRIIIILKEN